MILYVHRFSQGLIYCHELHIQSIRGHHNPCWMVQANTTLCHMKRVF